MCRTMTKKIDVDIAGQYQNFLVGSVFDNQDDELPKIPGEYILEKVFQIDVSRSKWLDLSVLFSMIFIYPLLFFAMIKVSEDVMPWVCGYIARSRVQHKFREAERWCGRCRCDVTSLTQLNSN